MIDIGLTFVNACGVMVVGLTLGIVFNIAKEMNKQREHLEQMQFNMTQIYMLLRRCELQNKEKEK